MADSKISALSSGAPAQSGDEYVIARSGANYKLTLANMAASMPDTTINGSLVVNEGGADKDTRIEGDTDANLVFVDASTDRVGLGLNNPDRLLDVDGSSKFRGQILITSGEALSLGLQALQLPTGVESTIGAGLSTRTGVAGESIIQFGNNMNTYYTGSVNAAKAGAMIRIDTRGVEPTPGASAYSVFQIQTRAAGVADPNYTVPVQIGAAPSGTFCIQTNGLATFNYGFVVNEGGGDYDTRFEGDTDTHLFFADASTDRIGIGTNAPGYKLDVNGTANFANNVTFTGGTANGVLYLNGSKVATSGSGLQFDGTRLFVGTTTTSTSSTQSGEVYSTGAVGFMLTNTTAANFPVSIKNEGSSGTRNLIRFYEGPAGGTVRASVSLDGSNYLTFDTNNFIINTGNLGIGTISPSKKLDVRTSASGEAAIGTFSNDSTAAGTNVASLEFASSGVAKASIAAAVYGDGWMSFRNNDNTEKMHLTASGNLGIGLTPAAKLDVLATTGTLFRCEMAGKAQLNIGNGGNSINYYDADSQIFRLGNGSEQMRLNSTGLGIGTSSPAKLLDLSANNNALAENNTLRFTDTDTSTEANQQIGKLEFYSSDGSSPGASVKAYIGAFAEDTTPDAYLAFATAASSTATERLRIDSSGNVGIGTSSPAQKLHVSGSGTQYIRLTTTSGAELDTITTSTDTYFGSRTNHPLILQTNNAERARITAGGDFLVGTTSNAGYGGSVISKSAGDTNPLAVLNPATTNPYGIAISFTGAAPNDATRTFLSCADTAATRATIRSNGGLANYQTNNVDLSDARTKNSITPAASMWDKVGALEIVTYKYNDQTHDDVNLGVIAQQVEAVEPVWVDTDGFGKTPDDGVPLKTVYTKDITFAAIKALQEAMARIEKLEAEMAALKGV